MFGVFKNIRRIYFGVKKLRKFYYMLHIATYHYYYF
jgi:hypothetical protein